VLVISGLVAMVVGVLVGLPSLRVRGPSLALVTLAVAYICQVAVFNDGRIFGNTGFNRVQTASLFGHDLDTQQYAVVVLVIVLLAMAGVGTLRMSTAGKRALAVRENEAAAMAAGINVSHYKLGAFAVSALMAGVGGALLSYQANVFAYERFSVFESLQVVALAYIGGIGMASGAIFAGLGAAGGLFSQLLLTWGADDYQGVIGGGVLLVAIQLHPDGIASLAHSVRALRARGAPHRNPHARRVSGDPPIESSTPSEKSPIEKEAVS
jgi:branched-chain amino acid transport system permease protein